MNCTSHLNRRVNPTLIHQLFLSLREILNLPCFAFILSMDRDRVAKAISITHPAYGSGHEFFEKIIDFPYYLPELTTSQVEAVFQNQLKNIVGITSEVDFSALLEYLPKNPRKLKLVARNIKILKNEILRHEEEEINWLIIIFLCVLKSHSQHAYAACIHEVQRNNLYDVMFLDDKDKQREKIKEKIKALANNCSDVDNPEAALIPLLEYLFTNYYELKGQNFSYFANLITKPHFLTWKEFKSLLAECKEKNAGTIIQDWITNTEAKRGKKHHHDIVSELFESATNYYSLCLENAANTLLIKDLNLHLSSAKQTLVFIEALFNTINDYGYKEFFVICDKILAWYHFQKNDADLEMRKNELDMLIRLTNKLSPDTFLDMSYELIQRHQNISCTGFGQEHDQPKVDLINKIIEKISPNILDNLLSKFEKSGEVRLARKSNGHTALGYLLLSNDSVLFKADSINTLDNVINQADTNDTVYENLKIYFDTICEYTSQQRFSKENAILVAPKLWSAVISQEIQYRSHSELLKKRKALIDAGVNEEALPKPQWLEN